MKTKLKIVAIVIFFILVVIGDILWLVNRGQRLAVVVQCKPGAITAHAVPFTGIRVEQLPDDIVIVCPD